MGILNPNVLFADDSATNQYICKKIFEKLEVPFEMVRTGKAVISACKRNSYDLIFICTYLPDMKTIEVIREIKTIDLNHHAIVIGVTANSIEEDYSKCVEAGMDDLISKPLEFYKLSDCITKWFSQNDISDHKAAFQMDYHDLPILEFKHVIHLFDNNTSAICEFAEVIINELECQIFLIDERIYEKNVPAIKRAAHRIKGAASDIGGKQVAALSKIIETLPDNESMDVIIEKFNELKVAFERLVKALKMHTW